MPYLDVAHVAKSYGDIPVLRDISFTADKGEVLALLGPSGCGKTTLLNVIAGFLRPDNGSVTLEGDRLNDIPVHRRDMGMVFQNYALFPHMTVAENVAFGLKMRKQSGGAIGDLVKHALSLVRLPDVETRYPRELSGGQRQRVAIARSLVIKPRVMLLDEPLSNLDALLRRTMRDDIRALLKQEGITGVLVTHDQEEAMAVADRIILLSSGEIEQMATPRELYEKPASMFAARFMEFENFICGKVVEVGALGVSFETDIGRFQGSATAAGVSVGDDAVAVIRPNHIEIARSEHPTTNRVDAVVKNVAYHGAEIRLVCDAGGQTLVVHVPSDAYDDFSLEQKIAIGWDVNTMKIIHDQ